MVISQKHKIRDPSKFFKTVLANFLDLNNIDEDSGEKIVVCNAHMHWDPEFSDVKMIQSFLLTTELDRITRQHSTNPQKMPGKLSVW